MKVFAVCYLFVLEYGFYTETITAKNEKEIYFYFQGCTDRYEYHRKGAQVLQTKAKHLLL